MIEPLTDPRRVDPPTVNADEKASYDAWLDWHRITLILKCEGLDDAGRKARPIPTSKMSLHGLVRHMVEVERGWFRRVMAQEPGHHFDYSADEDADFAVDGASWEDDLALFEAEGEGTQEFLTLIFPSDFDQAEALERLILKRWSKITDRGLRIKWDS